MRLLARLAHENRGAVTMLAAASMMAGLGCLAFAVDLGSLYFDSRRLQGMADAAALAAAADLAAPDAAARATVRANRWDGPVDARVVTGRYRADRATAAPQRFDPAAAAGDRDAARVTLSTDARLFFGVAALGRGSVRISRTATATRADLAGFSLGSRLAALDGGLANALLSGLTGSAVNLSVMDYDALAAAQVDLLAFTEALQTRLDLQAVSFDDMLSADMTSGTALAALADALAAAGQADAAAAARTLLQTIGEGATLPLSNLIDLGPLGAQDAAGRSQPIRVSAFDLTRAMLELAGGDRQVKLDLGASVPGLAKTSLLLAIGDRPANSPWLAVTDRGETIVRTAQTRLYLEATVGGSGALGIASVRLPLLVELAGAEARLASIRCPGGPATRSVALDVRPSPGHAAIADIDARAFADHRTPLATRPAKLVTLPLVSVSVTGAARVDLAAPAWQRVSFSADDIRAGRTRTVDSSTALQGIAGSLVRTIALDVDVAGLGLGLGPIASVVGSALAVAAPALDGVLNRLTGLLGLHLGQAEVRVNGVRCGIPALVA